MSERASNLASVWLPILVQVASAVALAVGASFFSDMRTEIKELRSTVGQLNTTLAVMQVSVNEIRHLREEHRAFAAAADLQELRAHLAEHAARDGHPSLLRRVDNVERQAQDRWSRSDMRDWIEDANRAGKDLPEPRSR